MRLPGTDPDCGPLLDLGQIRRQLRLGAPVPEGDATIPVSRVIGTAGRSRDFDGCFRPVHLALRKRIEEVIAAAPSSLDEPIEVIRVDQAYFVSDGHKRVAIARRQGREFIDARVSRMPSPYAFGPEIELEAVERTAREGEFRRHSGLARAVPRARFALTDVTGYGELLLAVQSYAYDRVLAFGRMVDADESARLWYEDRYLPTVEVGRRASRDLLGSVTDADLFLALHRQERADWGGECGELECIADMALAEQRRRAAAQRSTLGRLLNRDPRRGAAPALLLPLADEIDATRSEADVAAEPDAASDPATHSSS
ncbi:MAG TPA: hypothetical protein VHQ42_02360 [Candidatus Limnocylindria bacterium]|nr:hypothetical protein [Candidatus Limnocylindria bacterium]